MYIDWNGREQEDLEADNMRRDAREEEKRWRDILKAFIASLEKYDEENNTCYAAYLNESTDTFSTDAIALAVLLRSAVETPNADTPFNPSLEID